MKLNSDFMWSIYLIGTAVLFFCFGNFIGSSRTEKDLSQEIEEKNQTIKVLDRENQQLSEELTSRGIYSYPQAGIISGNQEKNLTLLIMLNGQKALKDLVVKRSIVSNYSHITGEDAANSAPAKRSSNLGILKSHTPAGFEVSMEENEAAIELSFESQNNHWKQHIRAKKNSEGKIATFWIITNGDNVVIDKHIDEGFPLEEDGSILLWKDNKVWYSEIDMNSTFRF